ncbi:uncharacterized protein BUCNMO_041 [Buchnera aphidicola (Nipponaphis monzeni)]|uniref:Uncharacterized protein n=1 Tax=Buchnera aphidicola (Nipponaphis monzeni) TaxID=2495405 RepID=A0A455T9S4_9GAMM|nr:uncharacterized protein BUCNMO_041 [Buchnera aphidicola (Nipponaphis monzeni)]
MNIIYFYSNIINIKMLFYVIFFYKIMLLVIFITINKYKFMCYLSNKLFLNIIIYSNFKLNDKKY